MSAQLAHEAAMDRAIMLARQAEETEDPASRYANAQLASTYVSMARELRLGYKKMGTYAYVDTPGLEVVIPQATQLVDDGSLPQPPFQEVQ